MKEMSTEKVHMYIPSSLPQILPGNCMYCVAYQQSHYAVFMNQTNLA